jgi:hypothetical protein
VSHDPRDVCRYYSKCIVGVSTQNSLAIPNSSHSISYHDSLHGMVTEVFWTSHGLRYAVFWDVARMALVSTDVSEERSASIIRVTRISELGTTLAVFLRSVCLLLVTANVLSSPILVTLMREVRNSSENSVLTRATWRNIPEDGILQSYRHEVLKSCIALTGWALWRRRNVSPVGCEPVFHIPEDGILHSHRPGNL